MGVFVLLNKVLSKISALMYAGSDCMRLAVT